MIGNREQGAIQGAVISAVSHEGLSVTFNGKPARLAIVGDDGQVIASGPQVAKEAEAVAVNAYRGLLKLQGHIRVVGSPIEAEGAIQGPGRHRRKR